MLVFKNRGNLTKVDMKHNNYNVPETEELEHRFTRREVFWTQIDINRKNF